MLFTGLTSGDGASDPGGMDSWAFRTAAVLAKVDVLVYLAEDPRVDVTALDQDVLTHEETPTHVYQYVLPLPGIVEV
jgi:hypothetical protein